MLGGNALGWAYLGQGYAGAQQAAATFTSSGTSASSFTANRARPATLTSAGTSSSTFSANRRRPAALTSSGSSSSAFVANRRRNAVFSSGGSSTSSFAAARKRAVVFASGGTSTSAFGATKIAVPVIYYVDPAGSDSNNGLATGTAWATLAKVTAGSYNPGDQILFKRGAVWRQGGLTYLTVPASGVSGNPITFGAYGSGANPILSGGSLVTGWSVFSGNTYRAALAATTNYVLAGSTPLVQGASTTPSSGQFFYSGGFLYVNLGGTNPTSLTVEASQIDRVFFANTKNWITVQDIDFQFGSDRALYAFTCSNWVIQRCGFRYTAWSANSGTMCLNYCNTISVLTCTFDQLQNDGVWWHDSPNVEIGRCTFANVGALAGDVQSDGIQIADTFDTTPSSNGLWIHDNTITMGAASPKGCIIVGADQTIGATATGIVERNVCDGGNYGIGIMASGLVVRDNVLKNQVSTFGGPIHVDTAYGEINDVILVRNVMANSNRDGIIVQLSAIARRNWTIANNTMVNIARSALSIQSPISGQIKNNIIWYTSTPPSAKMIEFPAGIVSGETLTWDYNLVRDPGTGTPFQGPSASYTTFAAWKAGTGYDAHSLTSDPLFLDASAGNYFLAASSPAIDAGVAVTGIGQIVSGTAPDIGAFERVVFVSSGTSSSSFTATRVRAAVFSSAGSSTSTFGANRFRDATITSAGTSTSSFAAARKRAAAFASAGNSTSAFAANRLRLATFTSAGTSTSAFATNRLRPVSFSSTGTSTSSFAANRRRNALFSSAGTSTSTWITARIRGTTFSSTGTSTSTFTANRRRGVVLSSPGASTSSFSANRYRNATFTSTGASTSTFTAAARRAVAFTSSGSSTSTFTATKAGQMSFTSAGTSTSSFTRTAKRALTLTSAGTSTSTLAANRWRTATFTSAGTSSSTWTRAAKRAVVLTSTGTSSSTFAANRRRGATLTSTGSSTSTFGVNRLRGVTVTSSGTSTSTFSAKRIRAVVLTSTGTSTTVFAAHLTRGIAFNSTGNGTSSFTRAAIRQLVLVSHGFSTSTFGITASNPSLGQTWPLRAGRPRASIVGGRPRAGVTSRPRR